jgi:predicted dehydrogenase
LHASAAIQALRSGKHVLVEKPMALTGNLCDEMIREAEKSGRILMTAQVLRFFPAYLPLTDLIKGGRLGPVRSAVFRRRCAAPGWSKWLADPSQSGGGVFDLLIHDVDQCVDLFGVPEKISATGHVDLQRGIDQITAQLFYPGVGSVVVTGGWHHPKAYPFSMEYTISGDNGTVEYSSAGRDPAWYTPDGETQMLPLAEKDGFEAEIQYWVGCCNSNRKPERCPPEESALSVKLMWALVEARERNGEKVDCKL